MEGKRKVIRGIFRTLYEHLFTYVWDSSGKFKDGAEKTFVNYEPFKPFYGSTNKRPIAKTVYEYMVDYIVWFNDPNDPSDYSHETRSCFVKIIPRLFNSNNYEKLSVQEKVPGFTVIFSFLDEKEKDTKYRVIVDHPKIYPNGIRINKTGNPKVVWIIKDPTNWTLWEGCIINGKYRSCFYYH